MTSTIVSTEGVETEVITPEQPKKTSKKAHKTKGSDSRSLPYKTDNPAAPYGYLKDGVTPRKRPGRKPKTSSN